VGACWDKSGRITTDYTVTPAMSTTAVLLGYAIYDVKLIQTAASGDIFYEDLPFDSIQRKKRTCFSLKKNQCYCLILCISINFWCLIFAYIMGTINQYQATNNVA